MADADFDERMMRRAITLAAQGQGWVEPNPMVGCVVTQGNELIGEGWHERYGEAHAEVNALRNVAERSGDAVASEGSTIYVTLEPCCHQGKTPPCSAAVIAAKPRRVVVAQRDPFSEVNGGGIAQIQRAGIQVEVGCLQSEAERLTAPYLKLVRHNRPWVIGKWAMTLDGKIASREFDSQWISNTSSRSRVHQLRGRVDAILVGRETAARDNPQLTARPAGPRTATRIVIDSQAQLDPQGALAQTARDVPVLIATQESADVERVAHLQSLGCEVFVCTGESHTERLGSLLTELGRRRITNVLVEGGGQVLGSLRDINELDEVHVFVAPKLIGGEDAITPMAGFGAARIELGSQLEQPVIETLDGDIYIHGPLSKESRTKP